MKPCENDFLQGFFGLDVMKSYGGSLGKRCTLMGKCAYITKLSLIENHVKMRDWDLQFFVQFIKRPGMYTGEKDNNGIEIFLIAYECGSKGGCGFRRELSEQIKNDHGVPMPSKGLIEQIKKVGKETNQDWYELFKKESMKLLCFESDKDGKARFASIIRKWYENFLKEIPKRVDFTWRVGWHQIYRETIECLGSTYQRKSWR